MLENKVAIITGGSKGIGYGIAQSFLEQGMKVAITSRSQANADKAASSLGDTDRVMGIESDVRKLADEQAVVQKVLDKWGRVDAVIANAGVGHFAPIQEMTDKQWHEVIDINLNGVFHTTKASLPALKESKGYLITIASLAGTNFFAQGAAYNASKFGLVGFSQAVMLDVRKDDVKVTTIMPGSVATHFNGNDPDDKDAWKIQPEDIGKLCVDLLTMPARSLPSKIEIRPSRPDKK
jgi:NAD(P)-dependent dehydrogenase (short-subunit alcohol dehydrogenase family)